MLADSSASFQARADELDSSGSLKAALATAGIKSFRQLAFSLGTPQQMPTQTEFQDFAQQVLAPGRAAPPLARVAILRALHFEATTVIVATIKESVAQ